MTKTFPPLLRTSLRLMSFPLGLLLGHTLLAAVTFTNTPSEVSNTYNGTITLQIGGIPTGDTVMVQKFIDLNTNGVIDGNDWLVQQFQLTDGQAGMVIGGVINSNVPGDFNSTTGAITATLNFQNGDFMQNIVGKFLLKLSSPVGHFTPLTNSFIVTNFPYAQKITGSVVSNGVAVPNACVLLFAAPRPGNNGPGGPPVAGTVANNSGAYAILAPVGTYMPMAFKSNYVVNFAALPVLTLGSGTTITTNLTLTNATASISGKVVDANNSSIDLPGILMSAQATNGLMGIGFTDTNGNFTVGVQSGQWGVHPDDTSLIVHGYPGLDNRITIDTTTGSVANVTIALPQATAMFYGSVTDSFGKPLTGIDVYVEDYGNHQYETDGYTDTNGNYFAAVPAGDWYVSISSDASPTNYVFSGGQEQSLTNGQVVQWNFTALLATNHITGWLKDNNNNPISGVGIWANTTINVADYQAYADTDTNGQYSLNVANGTWTVGVESCSDCDDGLPGNYLPPANQSVTITNNNGTANFTVESLQPLQMTTNSLPGGTVGVYYDQSLGASGGQPPYSWWLPGGTITLPPGTSGDMNFSSDGTNGTISGIPATAGTFSFWVGVSDNASPPNVVTQMFSITIQPAALPLEVATTWLPNGTNGVYYSQSLGANGGQPPYNWSLSPGSASLPPGLLLTATNGVISGTPTHAGTYDFSVRVTDNVAATADQFLSLTITGGLPDVLFYYVTKLEAFVQLDPTNIVFNTNAGPFTAFLGIVQSALGVVPIANVTLPTGALKALPWGSSAIDLSSQESFSSQAKFDAAYPPGNYDFALYALDDGLMYPVLSMPAPVYPNPPHVSNFAAAQSLNPLAAFTLQWDAVPGGTTNDTLWVVITDTNGTPVFSTPYPATDLAGSLKGTATLVVIPTNTFQLGHAYAGTITFFRTTSVNTTDYPGAVGVTVVAVQTWFPLTTISASPAPVLSQPTKLSNTQFRFQLSGIAGQNYTVQYSTTLRNWNTLYVTNAPANSFLLIDLTATNAQRFYRVLVGP